MSYTLEMQNIDQIIFHVLSKSPIWLAVEVLNAHPAGRKDTSHRLLCLQQSFRKVSETRYKRPPTPRHVSLISHQNRASYHLNNAKMGRNVGDKDLSPIKKGEILYAVKHTNDYDSQIARTVVADPKTVGNIRKRVYEADKENINPEDLLATKKQRIGRPLKLDSRNKRRLARHATKNRYQRRKSWFKIANELGIVASRTCINDTFRRMGFIRRPPAYKPPLSRPQMAKRMHFCTEWHPKLAGKEAQIIYCDETTVRVGEDRGQTWVTRTKGERFHPDCISTRYRGFTELMFWGCYTKYLRGPSYILDKETEDEKDAAKKDLDKRNTPYHVER